MRVARDRLDTGVLTAERAGYLAIREALHQLRGLRPMEDDPARLLGALLAAVQAEAEQQGGPQLWDQAVAEIRRIRGEAASQ